MNHREYMARALELAHQAGEEGDVPVGCVIVKDGQIVGRGRNRREENGDATAHAEMEAIREACARLGSWRLHGCTMYVTLEPCAMCAAALAHARLAGVVYGAADDLAGAVISRAEYLDAPFCNHRVWHMGGVRAEACAVLLRDFFERKR